MGIKDVNFVLGNNINGSFYVSDRYGGLIGWYDEDSRTLYVDERYKYVDKLIEKCINEDFQILFKNIEEDEILKYFARKRIIIRDNLIRKKKINDWIDKNLKLVDWKAKKRKVKNAEQKIKKRHG